MKTKNVAKFDAIQAKLDVLAGKLSTHSGEEAINRFQSDMDGLFEDCDKKASKRSEQALSATLKEFKKFADAATKAVELMGDLCNVLPAAIEESKKNE